MSSYFNFIDEKLNNNFKLNILEIGSGDYSLFEKSEYENITAIDKSVDKILAAPTSQINYLAMDLCSLNFEKLFDTIVDSHALHCILDSEERVIAYKNVYDNLVADGLFIAEMMIKKNSSDSYFTFPERLVLSSFEIEAELIRSNFKIKYFSVIPNLYFLDDVTKKNTCDLLRFVAQK